MLAIYKFINHNNPSEKRISIQTSEKDSTTGFNKRYPVGEFLNTKRKNETSGVISTGTYIIQFEATITGKYQEQFNVLTSEFSKQSIKITEDENFSTTILSPQITLTEIEYTSERIQKEYDDFYQKIKEKISSNPQSIIEDLPIVSDYGYTTFSQEFDKIQNINITKYPKVKRVKTIRTEKVEINNPLLNFDSEDAFKLTTKPNHYYIRFGALLEYIKDNIIIKIKDTNEPIFEIDTNEWETHMYSLPNQISLDPRVCLVRNDKFDTIKKGITNIFGNEYKLCLFKEVDNGKSTNDNAAYPLNIYLNFDFILDCLKADEKGNVSVYQLISNICTGLNKALGGINNLEPIIDETDNTLRIIDTTPIPKYSAESYDKKEDEPYALQIYGYNKLENNYISNFVRKVDLKTAITPEYATMITVGATAGGYVKGVEATAFSRWNTGLTDRFKEEFLPPNGTKESPKPNEASFNYIDTFLLPLKPLKISNRFGLTSFGENKKFSDNIIEKNISVVTEYYKWLIAENTKGKAISGGTVGFIPFKLGLTLDGISGIKIYNVLRVNTEFLPKAYGKSVDLIITGVSHRLSNNDWETSIESTVMPKTGEMALAAITAEQAEETLNNAGRLSSCPAITFSTNDSSKRKDSQTAAKEAKKIFSELSNKAIAGMLGVLQHESQFNPTAYNSSGGGCGALGIAQWRAKRQDNLFNFAQQNNLEVNFLITQLKFIKKELSSSYPKLWELLQNDTLSLIQYTAIYHISQGLGSSNPYDYYKKITNQKEYVNVYLSKNGPTPKSIPKRIKYSQTILNYLNTL
jgi:hypothetical protein